MALLAKIWSYVYRNWRFDCAECSDTGWVSIPVKVGPITYHTCDYCKKCRPRATSS